MFGSSFYHKTIRMYVIYFGTLFNDLKIDRIDKNNNKLQTFTVPIQYGPKAKYIARLLAAPNLENDIEFKLPMLAFEMTGLSHDPSRELLQTGIIKGQRSSDLSRQNYIYNPVAYNFNFSLTAFVKNPDDGLRITEQILPYFRPDFTATLNLLPGLFEKIRVPVILDQVLPSDNYETATMTGRRIVTWDFKFTMQGYLFGPIKHNEIIKKCVVHFIVPDGDLNADNTSVKNESKYSREIATIKPVLLDENGNEVPLSDIKSTDDYGFSEEIIQYK